MTQTVAARAFVAMCGVVAFYAAPASAEVPFITDDPGVLAPNEFDGLVYGDGTWTGSRLEGEVGIDAALGIVEGVEIGVIVPLVRIDDEPDRIAIGDLAVGTKVSLYDQAGFAVALAPALNIPFGAGERKHVGLDLPVWVGFQAAEWSITGGGGAGLSSDEDGGDLAFAGIVASRRIAANVSLGAEFYAQSAETGGKPLYLAGPGIAWDFAPGLTLAAGAHGVLAHRRENGRVNVFLALRLSR